MEKTIPLELELFFKDLPWVYQIPAHLFVIRKDGIVLFQNKEHEHIESIGALMGGVWQAAKELSNITADEKSDDLFRLSFDTSNQGIYILPLTLRGNEYYLGYIYSDEVNPGAIKNKLRVLAREMMLSLSDKSDVKENVRNSEASKSEFLFDDITDEELDSLFSF